MTICQTFLQTFLHTKLVSEEAIEWKMVSYQYAINHLKQTLFDHLAKDRTNSQKAALPPVSHHSQPLLFLVVNGRTVPAFTPTFMIHI